MDKVIEKKIEGDMAEKFRSLKDEDITEAFKIEHTNKMNLKHEVDGFNESITRKAVIRYVTIVVDMSSAVLKQDFRPNRAVVVKDMLSAFIRDFSDQNPLSKISVIVTY